MPAEKSPIKFLIVIVALVAVLSLTGCTFDLGKIENEEDFYKKFPTATFIVSDTDSTEVESRRLYNEEAINDFKCDLEKAAYKYMAVRVGEDLTVDEFAVFVRSDADVTLKVEMFIAPIPMVIATGDEDKDFETVSGSGTAVKRLKEFDEPKSEDCVATATVALRRGEWESFTIKKFSASGSNLADIALEKGDYMLFRFVNNCVEYGEDEKIIPHDEYRETELTFTAMLIRVI